jgi:hypothetical protein
MKVTVLPPSFDYWNGNYEFFMTHFYSRNEK